MWMIEDLARVVVRRRAMLTRSVSRRAEIVVRGTDISARDNAALGTATSTIVAAFSVLRDWGLVDDAELLRMAYRFAGETVDIEEMLQRGKVAGPRIDTSIQKADPTNKGPARPGAAGKADVTPAGVKIKPVKVDPISGEPEGLK